MKTNKTTSGFGLVEILVVIGIIGILSAVLLTSVTSARESARVTRAKTDLRELRTAISHLEIDTGLVPGATDADDCVQTHSDNELYLNTTAAGIEATDGSFPGWNGPYMGSVPDDPWENSYVFDADYECTASPLPEGCESYSGQTVRAIHSFGPSGDDNDPFNDYHSDEIVLVLCTE